MSRAFLSLGSNLGDRLAYLQAALDALRRGPSVSLISTSKVYETTPVEVEGGQPDYVNCVAELECGLPAIELLRYCQGIESALGREHKGEKAPRTVDVDMLLFAEEIIEEPGLEVPHRGVTRAFNLKGLADLDPDLHVPGRGRVGDRLAEADLSGITELGEVEALLC
jgi:2-amino-4-hydroxy-6-hydroxymethyldihydropteridine diphosphokinase